MGPRRSRASANSARLIAPPRARRHGWRADSSRQGEKLPPLCRWAWLRPFRPSPRRASSSPPPSPTHPKRRRRLLPPLRRSRALGPPGSPARPRPNRRRTPPSRSRCWRRGLRRVRGHRVRSTARGTTSGGRTRRRSLWSASWRHGTRAKCGVLGARSAVPAPPARTEYRCGRGRGHARFVRGDWRRRLRWRGEDAAEGASAEMGEGEEFDVWFETFCAGARGVLVSEPPVWFETFGTGARGVLVSEPPVAEEPSEVKRLVAWYEGAAALACGCATRVKPSLWGWSWEHFG